MSDSQPPYVEAFPAGTRVRVAERAALERFRAAWTLHDPLALEQLAFAGAEAAVAEVGFYHGGAALYRLAGVPGVWHEQCLVRAP